MWLGFSTVGESLEVKDALSWVKKVSMIVPFKPSSAGIYENQQSLFLILTLQFDICNLHSAIKEGSVCTNFLATPTPVIVRLDRTIQDSSLSVKFIHVFRKGKISGFPPARK
jgi:hypothetical protein